MANSKVIENIITRPNLHQHYLNESSADVFFICSGGAEGEDKEMKERVPAHKVILASVSQVFQAMFYGQLAEKNEIEITDATACGLKQFLQLFYKNEVSYTVEHFEEVLYLAEKYNVPDCTSACCSFFENNFTMEKFISCYDCIVNYKLSEVKLIFEEKIFDQRKEFFQSTYFLECSQTSLQNLLRIIYLKGEGELLLLACINWTENACNRNGLDSTKMEKRREMLGDCMELIEIASIRRDVMEYLRDFHSFF